MQRVSNDKVGLIRSRGHLTSGVETTARMEEAAEKKSKRRQRRSFTEEFKAGAVRLVIDERKTIAPQAE